MPDNSPARCLSVSKSDAVYVLGLCGYDNMQGMFNLIPRVPFIGVGRYMFACVSTSLGHANTYICLETRQGHGRDSMPIQST